MASPDLEREVLAWREARIARLTTRDGWLSLIGKVYLEPGTHSVGSAAGSVVELPDGKAPAELGLLQLASGVMQFAPSAAHADVRVQRAGASHAEPVNGPITLKSDARGAADRLLYGDLVLEIMERGDTFAVRVRDLSSRARLEFGGIDYFPIADEWRIEARLERYEPVRGLNLLYETGAEEAHVVPGALVFAHGGVEHRLDPVLEADGKRLFVLFADPTNRDQSYGAGRFLYAPLPERDRVVLDFNQAFSPPCAFTPHALCPLPPPQNRLALRVEAGEKRPITGP
jgi:uncharacterized protein